MKTSFLQIFDKKDEAIGAAAFMSGEYPDHDHSLIESSNQIQIWRKLGGQELTEVLGSPNESIVFLVISTPPS